MDKFPTLSPEGLKVFTGLVKKDIKSIDTKIGDLNAAETADKTDVVAMINELVAAIGTGGTGSVVTIDTSSTTEGMLKSYVIKQGGKLISTIDIPKDLVVTSGTVIQVTDEDTINGLTNGTYIKLVIANQDEPLYIDVGTLVDLYTALADATQVQLTVNNITREISASIVAKSITAAELADACISVAKLGQDVITRFTTIENKIAALEEKVGEGFESIPEATIREIFATTSADII